MIFASKLARLRDQRARRSLYASLAAEIEAMSPRDLIDINANRDDLLRHAYNQVFGRESLGKRLGPQAVWSTSTRAIG